MLGAELEIRAGVSFLVRPAVQLGSAGHLQNGTLLDVLHDHAAGFVVKHTAFDPERIRLLGLFRVVFIDGDLEGDACPGLLALAKRLLFRVFSQAPNGGESNIAVKSKSKHCVLLFLSIVYY